MVLLQIVKEFLKALAQKRTYNITKNWYCFFGVLWGIPIPVVTIAIDIYSQRLGLTLYNIIHVVQSHPFHLFFLLHPLFFGIVFGAMGAISHNKEEKIQESERLKSNFLSMVSHELRTPLTTIQGYITFLRSEKSGTLNPAQKEYLAISEETADQLNSLIEELLDLSRIEAGEFNISLTKVDMKEIFDKAIASLKLFANEAGVALENNIPQGLPLVQADTERIFQVVTNLLKNAIKFNKRSGRASVTASFDSRNNKVIFCVSDTGIGIPHGQLGRIFDKFYQVDSSEKRRYGGCGLGLAISKSIIELHKGKIWAESKPGAGSKFFFEITV